MTGFTDVLWGLAHSAPKQLVGESKPNPAWIGLCKSPSTVVENQSSAPPTKLKPKIQSSKRETNAAATGAILSHQSPPPISNHETSYVNSLSFIRLPLGRNSNLRRLVGLYMITLWKSSSRNQQIFCDIFYGFKASKLIIPLYIKPV